MQKNRIELAGYLGAKPTLRHLPSGTKVANARLAEGYKYADKDKKSREHTNWHNLTFYGTIADVAMTYEKGENVAVEGTLQTRQFTPKDGSPRTVYEVIARSCHLIAAPRTQGEAPETNHPTNGEEEDGMGPASAEGVSSNAEWPA